MIKNFLDITFLKYILVGVISTIVGAGTMFLCYNDLNCSYWSSSAMNYIVGSIVSYFLNKSFTFQNKEHSWKIVAKFIINITVCYLLAYGVAKPLVALLLAGQSVTIQENGAMLVGMMLFAMLNYVGQRFFAFKASESCVL